MGTILLVGVAWIVVTAFLVDRAAHRIAADLQQARVLASNGDLAGAHSFSADLTRQSRLAHRLSTGPAWWAASVVPYLGRPVQVLRGSADAADQIGSAVVPQLVDIAAQLAPGKLHPTGDSIDVAPIIAAAPRLHTAAGALRSASELLAGLPSSTWLSAADQLHRTFTAQVGLVDGYVTAADRTAQVLPSMVGSSSPKRYFVGLQNEAELRGTGGVPGAFAILVADHGTITFTHFESDQTLLPAATGQLINTGLGFGPAYDAAWGPSLPTQLYVNSNLSPNFPYAAQIWASMWEKVSGEHVDGAIALDPTALSYFLAVTGPAALPTGGLVSASTVVSLTEKDEYVLYPNLDVRKQFLVGLIHATDAQLISGKGNPQQLVSAAATAGTEHRLLIWSSDPAVEAVLRQSSFGGALPGGSLPFSGVVVNNLAAGKLDYYLGRALTLQRTGCGSTRDVLVTIGLTNGAPAAGLPPYVDTRLDSMAASAKPGDNRLLVDYFATAGAQLLSATLDGNAVSVGVLQESGHPVFRYDLELPQGQTQTIVLHLREPAGPLPTVWQQPGVSAMAIKYYDQACN